MTDDDRPPAPTKTHKDYYYILGVRQNATSEEIQEALRALVDPVFLPRPLVCVPSLPRNATGKLMRESVKDLARQWLELRGYGA